jgi:hypothetical protein
MLPAGNKFRLPAGNKSGERGTGRVLRSADTNDFARHYWLHALFFKGFHKLLITGDYASHV